MSILKLQKKTLNKKNNLKETVKTTFQAGKRRRASVCLKRLGNLSAIPESKESRLDFNQTKMSPELGLTRTPVRPPPIFLSSFKK